MRIFFALLLLPRLAFSAGGTALDAYNFATGARMAGLGGAATAVVADPTALQWNPAGLARVGALSASLSHLIWVADISYSYAGATVPIPVGFLGMPLRATAGASVQVFNYGPIESTRGLDEAAAASDLGLTVGGGLSLLDQVSAGVAVKYFRHALDDASVSEAAVDVGLVYEALPERIVIAAVCQNAGYAGALDGHRPAMPVAFKLGGALSTAVIDLPVYGRGIEPLLTLRWQTLGAVDFTAQKGEPGNYNFGVETGLNDLLFLRGGYLRQLQDAGGGLSAGMGLKFGFFGSTLKLDYAFGSVGDLGDAQYMTLSWTPSRRRVDKGEGFRVAADAPAAAIDVAAEYRAALDLYAAGQYAAAGRRAAGIVAVEPGHWQAWQLIGNCRYAAGDAAGAVEAYRESLKVNPENSALKAWLDGLKAD